MTEHPSSAADVVVPLNEEIDGATLAHLPYAEAKKIALRAFERRYLATVLERANGNVSSASRAAGVDRSNFRRLLKQYEVGGRSMHRLNEAEPPQGEGEAPDVDGSFEQASTGT